MSMLKKIGFSSFAIGLLFSICACSDSSDNTLCGKAWECADTWCNKSSANYSSCMAKHDETYGDCQEALANVWYRNATCAELYNKLYDCVSTYIYCSEQYDVYLSRLHSIENNECSSQYNKLLEECAGL